MRIDQLRNSVINEELDYVMLMSLLSGYANPRDKISRWLRSGDLIRVKKGLYIFGPELARTSVSLETLANQIYGPSAISLEYALSWYGFIPERVTVIQSVTTSRNKMFKTPLGVFTYTYQQPDLFAEGTTLVAPNPTHNILMATREKALTDFLTLNRSVPYITTTAELYEYLTNDMRIDAENLYKLNLSRLRRIEKKTRKRNVSLLGELIARKKGEPHA